jgi:hypothetical protein
MTNHHNKLILASLSIFKEKQSYQVIIKSIATAVTWNEEGERLLEVSATQAIIVGKPKPSSAYPLFQGTKFFIYIFRVCEESSVGALLICICITILPPDSVQWCMHYMPRFCHLLLYGIAFQYCKVVLYIP